MLYVFYGTDEEKVRQAAHAKVDTLRSDRADAELVRLEPDQYEVGQLQSLSGSVALFGAAPIYLVDTPSESEAYFAELLAEAEVLGAAAADFIVIETALLAAPKKALAAGASEMTEYKRETKERFDTFALADALAKKDKRTLWILLQDAVREGLPAEEIIGVLWWQLKTMRLAHRTKSAAEAGVKDFPYNKAKRSLANFKPGEVEALSRGLLGLYHDGHIGKCDINLALEEWVLRM